MCPILRNPVQKRSLGWGSGFVHISLRSRRVFSFRALRETAWMGLFLTGSGQMQAAGRSFLHFVTTEKRCRDCGRNDRLCFLGGAAYSTHCRGGTLSNAAILGLSFLTEADIRLFFCTKCCWLTVDSYPPIFIRFNSNKICFLKFYNLSVDLFFFTCNQVSELTTSLYGLTGTT